jgi:hypothetical protein
MSDPIFVVSLDSTLGLAIYVLTYTHETRVMLACVKTKPQDSPTSKESH